MYLIWFNLLSECEGVDMCCSVCICFVACGSTRQLDWRFDFLVCERGQGGLEKQRLQVQDTMEVVGDGIYRRGRLSFCPISVANVD